MSIYFEEIHVLPKYPDKVFVQWSMNNSSLPENYLFEIFWSSSPETNFVKLNETPIVNDYSYTFPFALLTKDEYLWIKLRASVGDLEVFSNPQGLFYNLRKKDYLLVKEMIRKKNLLRVKKVGLECKVFKRIIFGAPCPTCIDVHTGMNTDSKCTDCFGTGKYGGYHTAIDTHVEIVEAARNTIPSEIGTIENRVATGALTYPIVQKGDVVVENGRNRRWYINGVEREALRTVPVDQRVELRQIAPKDIEYRLGE